MITLSDGTNTVELPPELQWTDRTWTPVKQSFTRGLTGKPIIQSAAASLGRPITLDQPNGGAWWSAAVAKEQQVLQWYETAGQVLTLTIRGTSYTVRFRHHEPPAYEAAPLFYEIEPGADYILLPTFRFITVEP